MQSNLRASSVFYNVVGGSQNLDCSPGRRGGTAGINVHTPLGSVPSFVVRHSRARVASAEPRGSRARRVVTARRSRVARWRVPGSTLRWSRSRRTTTTMTHLRGPRLLAALGVRVPARPGSDRDAASSSSFVDAFRRDFWLYAVFFLLTAAQALPLTAIQHLLNRELGLEDHPETINRFFAVEFAVSTLKPAYAAVSDLCPSAAADASRTWSSAPRRTPWRCNSSRACGRRRELYAAGVFGVACYAACESAADGVLVSVSRTNERDALAREDHLEENHRSARAMRAQALGMTVRSARASSRRRRASPSSPSSTRGRRLRRRRVRRPRRVRRRRGRRTRTPLARSRPARREHRPPDASVPGRRLDRCRSRSDPAAAGDERIVLPAAKASASAFFSGREASPRTSHRRRGASLGPTRRGGVRVRVSPPPDRPRDVLRLLVRAVLGVRLVPRRVAVFRDVRGNVRQRRLGALSSRSVSSPSPSSPPRSSTRRAAGAARARRRREDHLRARSRLGAGRGRRAGVFRTREHVRRDVRVHADPRPGGARGAGGARGVRVRGDRLRRRRRDDARVAHRRGPHRGARAGRGRG